MLSLQDCFCATGGLSRYAISMAQVAEPYIRRRAIRHLEKGRISTSLRQVLVTLTSPSILQTALRVARLVPRMKATKADGIYDCDPVTMQMQLSMTPSLTKMFSPKSLGYGRSNCAVQRQ